MSVRSCTMFESPTLAEAESEASSVNNSQTLFGEPVTSTAAATAATVFGVHYLLVKGPEDNIDSAMAEMPSDWRSTWAESREGDDAGASTWLPSFSTASYLLGLME